MLLSIDAWEFFEEYVARNEQQQQVLPPATATVETATKLQAINVASTAVIDQYDPMANAKIDIISEMSDRISNTIVFGIPGSGKTLLVSNAVRAAKAKHPKLKIFVIDPKGDTKEQGYFDSCDVVKQFQSMDAKPSSVAVWAEAAFNEYAKYAQSNERTLLICDEGSMLGNKLQQAKSTLLVDKLTSYTSGSDSAGRNVWFLMQTPM
ncbi:MAG: type IV secretion system DNA-binding domain-containing protein [Rhizonema sp. PD38]|nr:type IV secretion system DNA-binding domain-containing protein [Rhizonema sp. PD38]